MRIRSIKPEYWRSDDIVQLDIPDRLLFIGLWSYVDDNGVGRDQVALVVADLFAHDMERDARETFARVSRGLQTLADAGLIARYEVDGKRYLEVVSWKSHQRIDRPGKARFPAEPEGSRQSREDASSPRVNVAPGAGDQGAEEQGNKGAVEQVVDDVDEAFESAWSHWPKKDKKKPALAKFRTAAKKRGLDQLTADVTIYGDAYRDAGTETRFIPGLEAWLNQERWTDPLPQPSTPASTGHERAAARQAANMAVVEHFRNLEADTGTIWEIEA